MNQMNTNKKWYQLSGSDADVVISTRIRLARNIRNFPFPCAMNDEQRTEVNKLVREAIPENAALKGRFKYIELSSLGKNELVSLVERHLISPDFARNPKGRGLLLLDDESVSIMICEEDHLRIQVLSQGMDAEKAFDTADKLDTLLSEQLSFAANEKLGYLTACPTNLGTGMRASVMVHLPALEACGALNHISGAITKMGMTIRGMYGEGSGSRGAIYQISNQVTLGISEKDTIAKLRDIIAQITKLERDMRDKLMENPSHLDKIWRALGVMKTARMLSSEEFVELWSSVREGTEGGKLDGLTLDALSELFVEVQPATMMMRMGRDMTPAERDVQRAEITRKMFAHV